MSIEGITTRCASSGSTARSKCAASSVAKCGDFVQSGLPITMLLAVKLGQGIQARQPVSPEGRRQPTLRSPWIANGRPISVLTRSLIYGLARFQSNVRMKTTSAAISTRMMPTIQAADLPMTRVSVMPGSSFFLSRQDIGRKAAPDDLQAGYRYYGIAREASFSLYHFLHL